MIKKQEKKQEKQDYVGETERVLRDRMYEHRVIDHKTARRAASINHQDEERKESQRTGREPTRKSSRTMKKKDYKTMHEGGQQQLTEGSTEFSAHIASDTHTKDDVEHKILMTDDNWFRRGVKEAIAIRKIRPTLNQDDGRHHLSPMYNKLIRSNVTMATPCKGTEDASVHSN